MRYLLMLDTPFWMLVCLTLWLYALSLRRRLRGLNEPVLLLSRRERRAYAREQLELRKRADDEAHMARLNDIITGVSRSKSYNIAGVDQGPGTIHEGNTK